MNWHVIVWQVSLSVVENGDCWSHVTLEMPCGASFQDRFLLGSALLLS